MKVKENTYRGVFSEYHPLERVVIHAPGFEWEMVPLTPNMAESYLVEDILYLKHAREDHFEFAECLRHIAGAEGVFEFTDLLSEVLENETVRRELLEDVAKVEKLSAEILKPLYEASLSAKNLALALLSGATPANNSDEDSSAKESSAKKSSDEKNRQSLFPPIPNMLFTRDIGACIGKFVILSHPAFQVRRREGVLARAVFANHPIFSALKIIDISDGLPLDSDLAGVTLEGGDIMALDSETLVVGCGERSQRKGVDLLVERALKEAHIKRVIVTLLPPDRATMHLDTVFTVIGPEDCVYYPPLFDEDGDSEKLCTTETYEMIGDEVRQTGGAAPTGLFSALDRIGYAFPNRIKCGGDLPLFQAREQWTDGANLFAAKPTVAFIYERNRETIRGFEKAGYRVVTAESFLKCDPRTVTNTLVTVSGAELSRGRGGARCMTMPVSRRIP